MVQARPLRVSDPASIGPYTLVGVLGEGGQGTVYLGERRGEQVAVKLLHARFAEDDEARGRFVRELEVAKQVARFCTAQVLDADVEGDRPYIVSEFVPGISLQEQVDAEGPRAEGTLERLAINTLNALTAIHQAEIVHRDFKPHNVLIGPDGPRVIDFGIARALNVTSHSQNIGTPAYMSPEQLNGHQLTTASDLFSWAASMVFAATGAPPFGEDEIGAVVYRIAHAEADTGALPTPLREVVQACLAKDPAARPTAAQAQAMLIGGDAPAALLPRRPTVPVRSERPEQPEQPEQPGPHESRPLVIGPPTGDAPPGRRRPVGAVLVSAVLVAAVGVAAWALTRDDKPQVTAIAPTTAPVTDPGRPSRSASPKPGKKTKPRPTVIITVTASPSDDGQGSGPPAAAQSPVADGPAADGPAQPSSAPVKRNPHDPVRLCNGRRGGGFAFKNAVAFPGGQTLQLTNRAGVSCVVTLKTADLDRETLVFAQVMRQSDRRAASTRVKHRYYAGPIYLPTQNTCIRFAGGGPAGAKGTSWVGCG
ncbi:serine/threonine-protein kinase [Actinocorallia populi]|uniref:serine/threonine-protein kinase n=1 Tax=Actinocorallia populi TaxID=2079200 RepID=UPI000D097273|nr:serine/threonine-protein kinase [Actinocorallia populi]